jgi:hypothetical protein
MGAETRVWQIASFPGNAWVVDPTLGLRPGHMGGLA